MRTAGPGATTPADTAGRISGHPSGAAIDSTVPHLARHHRLGPVDDRGRTTVGHQVIEAIAARVAVTSDREA
jgi:hypothetical protein